MLVSLIGGGGDGGAGFWRKTSSKSSCDRPVEDSSGCWWSVKLKKLDSDIRNEDRGWGLDGWEEGRGDDAMLLLSFLSGGDASWKWGKGVCITGETRLATSAEYPLLISKLKALSLYVSFAVSSSMLASLKLCLVCLSITRVSLLSAVLLPLLSFVGGCGMPGKVMASRLALLSLSLACHSALLAP